MEHFFNAGFWVKGIGKDKSLAAKNGKKESDFSLSLTVLCILLRLSFFNEVKAFATLVC